MENTVWQQWADRVNKSVEEAVVFINDQQRLRYQAALADWEINARQAHGTKQPLPVKPPAPRQVIAVEYDAGVFAGLLYVNTNGPMEPEIKTQFEIDLSKPSPASGKAVVGEYWFKDLDGAFYYIAGAGDTAVDGQEATAADGTRVKKTSVPCKPFGRRPGYVKIG